MNCLLCLNETTDLDNSIQIESSTLDDRDVQSIIEKHLWPMTIFKSESRWLCMACWQELSGFHKFYKRIQDVHLKYECLLNTEPDYLSVPYEKLFEPEIELELGVVAVKQEKNDSDLDNANNAEDALPVAHAREDIDSNVMEDPLNKTQRSRKTRPERKSKRISAGNSKTPPIEKRVKAEVSEETDVADSDEDRMHKKDISKLSPDSKIKSEHESSHKPKISHERDEFIAKHFKLNCYICQESFETFPILLKHFEKAHQERGYVLCCEVKFYNRIKLVDHINFHLNPEYFKCTHCSKVVTQRKSLVNHMQIHKEKQFSCDICSKQFVAKSELDQHKLIHIPQEERKFPCAVCGKFYSSEAMLTRHQNAVHLNKYKKLCPICGQSTSDSTAFRLHMEKHEGIKPTTYSCDICGIIVAGKRHLKLHMNSQHPEGGKKDHTCSICSKISPTLKALKRHIQCAHEMGYNYKCSFCEKAFKRPETLKDHIATHTGNDLYDCPWCSKTFKSNGNMHQHRKNAHPKEWEENRRKRYSGKLPPNLKPPSTTANAYKNVLWA